MAHRQHAAHRTILVVDVQGFGGQDRTNRHQLVVRDGMYRALRRAFAEAGVRWDECRHEDRGDGVFVLVPAEVPKAPFVESLPYALSEALCGHNRTHHGQERIRLRMALHAGEVNFDDHGVTAAAINLVFRLVDAEPLRAALADSGSALALIVSSWFFDEVVRHSPASNPGAYRRHHVVVKETATTGWICVPERLSRSSETGQEPRLAAGSGPVPRRSHFDDSPVGAGPTDRAGLPVVVPTGQLPPNVHGRDRLLAQLRRLLSRPADRWVVLTGMGGVGKSTVAAAFAERVQVARIGLRRPIVWWVVAADQASLSAALVTVARQLGAARADIDAIGSGTADAPDRLWALLWHERRRWLLVFDNADDPSVLARPATAASGRAGSTDAVTRSVADGTGWVRPARRGLVVVTSRNAGRDLWGRHALVLPLNPLSEGDAARVLLDRAPGAGGDVEARALARRLGGLPLALRLAGSYLESGVALQASFRDYRLALDSGCARLWTSTPTAGPAISSRTVVMHTWEMSLDALTKGGVPQARPLLRLLSCYASATPIPLNLLAPERLRRLLAVSENTGDVLAGDKPAHRLEDGLYQLRQLSLIYIRPTSSDGTRERAVMVHPVIAGTNRAHLLNEQIGNVDTALVRRTAVQLAVDALAPLDLNAVATGRSVWF